MTLGIGCAMWANRDWIGRSLPAATRPADLLAAYSRAFDAVEGNTTFYGLPTESTVRRWLADTPDGFRFVFKAPRTVTHERRLRDAAGELAGFCRRLDPLLERLGPTSIQLPASFSPGDLPVLQGFLDTLPTDRPWAVEVRHRDFFAGGSSEAALDAMLRDRAIDRVVLDSRALFSHPPTGPAEQLAHEAKPRRPVRPTATASQPVVRFIGHLASDVSAAHWRRWFDVLGRWLRDGRRPLFFLHTADNVDAPEQARRFRAEIATALPGLVVPPAATVGPTGDGSANRGGEPGALPLW